MKSFPINEVPKNRGEKKLGALRLALLVLGTVLLLSQFVSYPSQVQNIGGGFDSAVSLEYPAAYRVFAPFFQAADALTLLSMYQHLVFLLFVNLLWLAFRTYMNGIPKNPRDMMLEILKLIGLNLAYAAAAAVIVLIPRPMAALRTANPDLLIVDFHSHTNHSWDARRSFSPRKNLEWHRRAGFNATFITDHNAVSGAEEALKDFEAGRVEGILPLRGEEVSLHKSHWAVLGNKSLIPNSKYDRGEEGIRDFLKDVAGSTNVCVIASLPEYWLHHWGEGVEKFIGWGAHGFELANSAPIALDFPAAKRGEIANMAYKNSLALTGITDNHGWGSTAQVWSAIEIPGWRGMSRQRVEESVVQSLRKNPRSVRIWARVKQEPGDKAWSPAADPFLQIWEGARSLPMNQRVICLLWLAGIGWALKALIRR